MPSKTPRTSSSRKARGDTGTGKSRTSKALPRIVGIGASAGGIGVLKTVLHGLPSSFGAPILVVQHLDQTHTSTLDKILARETALQVGAAKHGEALEPGHVYVATPGRHLTAENGRVQLTTTSKVARARPSVDVMFRSLAAGYGAGAIAVVLTGSGTDGAEGAALVKRAGGMLGVQDPATATHASMPQAAMKAGPDEVLPVERIADFLVRALGRPTVAAAGTEWNRLLAQLKSTCGTDFAGYRVTTLERRLQKRMLATGSPNLKAYLALVEKDSEEVALLHAAFLIKVSSFFRDLKPWRRLETEVIAPFARRKDDVRVWSAGCATGEEAYSVAMLLLDALPPRDRESLRVFATDLDEEALEVARTGVYEAAQMKAVSPAQRAKYFVQEDGRFRVRKELRKHVIFGRHDLIKDPPIASLDLLICRNVLIYMEREQKTKVLERFAFALKPGGVLFLGKSEGVQDVEEAFEPVWAQGRIYRRAPTRHGAFLARPHDAARVPKGEGQINAAVRAGGEDMRVEEAFRHLLLQSVSVLLIGVDRDWKVNLWNKAAERHFGVKVEKAVGRPLFEVADNLPADRLSKVMKQALREKRTIELRDAPCNTKGVRFLDIECTPLASRSGDGNLLMVAWDATGRHDAEDAQKEMFAELRKESAKSSQISENLQSANEELETLNEELQSTSEEQQTLNEELESTNEELETTNEELQSSNEEMNRLNDELRSRHDEVERIATYFRGVLDLQTDAIVVCDDQARVTFWSEGATRQFRVSSAQASEQDVFGLLPALDTREVRAAVRTALEQLTKAEVEDVTMTDGRHLRVAVSPARDSAGRNRGFIVLAADVTDRAAREGAVRASERVFRAITDGASDPMLLIDTAGRVERCNPAACAFFGIDDKKPPTLRDLLAKPAALEERLLKVGWDQPAAMEDVTVRSATGPRTCSVAVSMVKPGDPAMLAAVFHDVTERRQRELRTVDERDLLSVYNRILTHDVNNIATGVMMHLDLAAEDGKGKHLEESKGLIMLLAHMVENIRLLNNIPNLRQTDAVETSGALARALKAVKGAFPTRKVRVTNEAAPGLQVKATAALEQVFLNVIANGITHNKSAEVKVGITTSIGRLGKVPSVTFTFTDNGPGMPPDVRERLFESPLGAAPTSRHGLGLHIVRALVESWGGKIAVEAPKAPATGTILHVTLARA